MNISKDSLELFLEDCKANDDENTAMLIECILEAYKQTDAERAQKMAAVRASSEILAESRRKDLKIAELLKTIDQQNEVVSTTIAAFRKIYEMSVFGNKFFKADPMLRLWVSVEKFVSSTTENQFRENNIEMLSALSNLSQDQYLIDMRNNMINFRNYMESEDGQENQEGSTDTTGDNA
jgi:hypothetical protein